MKKYLQAAIILIALAATVFLGHELRIAAEKASPITRDERALYLAFTTPPSTENNYEEFIILEPTTVSFPFDDDYFTQLSENFPELQRETWNNFLLRNNNCENLPADLELGIDFQYLSEEILQENNLLSFWEAIDKTYNNGECCVLLVRFSRVGFDHQRTQALMIYSHSTGGLSGAAYFVFLVKVNGRWEVRDSMLLWIS